LAAIRDAIELGVDYVELDLRTTQDGQLVLLHDRNVDRTTNGKGAVRELTLKQVRDLDAGVKIDAKYAGERVPTFDEALELCKGKVHIYLDHKDASVPQALESIRKHGMEESVIIYDSPEGLGEWKRVAPLLPVMPSLPDEYRKEGGVAEFLRSLPAEVLDGNLVDWTKELVEQTHKAGAKVYVDNLGPNDNEEGFRAALMMGVDGIQTDHAEVLLKILSAR
jgi:glycerophosphoryl diester phosphodiesterase